jgi:predicted metal-dependent enzyme (double-stranded beta helix superfamily)
MFNKDQFVADCRAAVAADPTSRAVRDVVARAISDPGGLARELGEPKQGGLETLYRSPDLMILNVLCRPELVVRPHNHTMWAVIGVWSGREDNILWRRLPDEANGKIEAAGAKALSARETVAFGPEVIHSLINPLPRMSAAIHVYGGDLFGAHRSEWDPETLCEAPHDMANLMTAVGR